VFVGVKATALIPLGLLAAGALLVGLAALEGGAHLAVVVVIPVVYGESWLFGAGVLFLIAGLFTIPLAFERDERPRSPGSGSAPVPPGGAGGFVLIGPVPIFFGSWRGVSPRTRVILAVVGAALLVVLVGLFLLARG
jgi:uncharacterized membrane protein